MAWNWKNRNLRLGTDDMVYRKLGKTGLEVSEIGLGAEWLERHGYEEIKAVIDTCAEAGINILDCWMSEPNVRTNIGKALKGTRKRWIIQGHIGSTWQNGQYVRTRDMKYVVPAFEDLLKRLQTDYVDLGMIHYVDEAAEFERVMNSEYIEYVHKLKKDGVIRHVGMSSHNPLVAKQAVLSGEIELLLFSINPAFDLLPASEDINEMFAEQYEEGLDRISPERLELYQLCEEKGIGITVMKGYAGGRLFDANRSPFGVAMTPVQCLHYALTRPAVASVLVGYDTPEQVREACAYESADAIQKDYATVLANAPRHAFGGGQCTYCGHCAPCPSGIDIAMVNKLLDLATMQQQVPASVKSHYQELKAGAKDCVECGGCERRCPFGVKVMEKMKEAQRILEQ